jgi:replicative DNA helicase
VPAHTWLANDFIVRYPNKEEFVEQVIRFDERITNPLRIAHLALHFFPVIQAHLGLLDDSILELYSVRKQRNLQKKSNDIIQNAARTAKQLGAEGQHEAAKEALFEGYRESEALLRTSKLEPVRTLNERLLDHEAQILAYRDRDILGLKTDMKDLTAALMGLRGLIFLGSPPNLGKTVLSMQLALQVLTNHLDAGVIYINLDMDTNDVITRIRCNRGQYEWKAYTQGHDIPIESGREEVRKIGDRLVILDEKCFTGEIQQVIEVVNSLKTTAKVKRVLIVLDYLQVWEVPEDKRKILRTDNDIDEWRVAVVKQLKGALSRHDAVLVVSEVRKDAYNKPLSMEDLKGSSRLSYAGDTVLLLQRLTAEEYNENFSYSGGTIVTHWPGKRDTSTLVGKEGEKEAKKLQERLEEQSITVGWLQVAKGRDGTQRRKIPVTAFFKTASIIEGFYINGLAEQETQGARDDGPKGMDEGTVQEPDNERAGYFWQN